MPRVERWSGMIRLSLSKVPVLIVEVVADLAYVGSDITAGSLWDSQGD